MRKERSSVHIDSCHQAYLELSFSISLHRGISHTYFFRVLAMVWTGPSPFVIKLRETSENKCQEIKYGLHYMAFIYLKFWFWFFI